VAPTPWVALETRQPIGGESLIWLGNDSHLDQEMYISLYTGPGEIASPDVGLDAVVDFIAAARRYDPTTYSPLDVLIGALICRRRRRRKAILPNRGCCISAYSCVDSYVFAAEDDQRHLLRLERA
jgi:hypothetical protein